MTLPQRHHPERIHCVAVTGNRFCKVLSLFTGLGRVKTLPYGVFQYLHGIFNP